MGIVSSRMLDHGGKVHGIIPEAVRRPHTPSSRLPCRLSFCRTDHSVQRESVSHMLTFRSISQFLSAEAPDRHTKKRDGEEETIVESMHARKKLSASSVPLVPMRVAR